ncbi:MAG: (d)CMP kinase [Proteobacteria bacterium]|nr:(d)CMP kinase [Pseudomonadota bacterium]MCP4915740.1 (d)CMP kinase [Pseudomonadota bacterium]
MSDGGFAIAIDGPASSGKGTVARLVAMELDFAYIDSGAMYRAVALFGARHGLSLSDGPALARLIQKMDFTFGFEDGRFTLVVDGKDISRAIRTQKVGQGASMVAKLPQVRGALLGTQRGLATSQGVVMDGRDIGTVVLPDAQLKVFLDADLGVRARRRYAELVERGVEVGYEDVKSELAARDAQDAGREHAPLAQADDAIVLDSTQMTPEQVTQRVIQLARDRGAF